jgi:hypothetical protein
MTLIITIMKKSPMKLNSSRLTDEQKAAVVKEAKKTRQTQAEVIRGVIDEQLLQRNFEVARVRRGNYGKAMLKFLERWERRASVEKRTR